LDRPVRSVSRVRDKRVPGKRFKIKNIKGWESRLMIDLYFAETPNGEIARIMLEEVGCPYTCHTLDLFAGEHLSEEFGAISPSRQIPVIVDHDEVEGRPITISQTAAIVLYLAEKTGRLLPLDPLEDARAKEILSLHTSDLVPALYLAFHLERLLGTSDEAIRRALQQRGLNYYAILDRWLGDAPFMAGETCSYADIAVFPWAHRVLENSPADLPNLKRWVVEMRQRPSVKRVLDSDATD